MYDIWKVMKARHSVRHYSDRPIEAETAEQLNKEIESINRKSGLYFELCLNNDEVFCANKPHYGNFTGCRNFIMLNGPDKCDEAIGYYGERLVLFAQSIGLNTCWVALTFEKKAIPTPAPKGMKLFDVLALGYGSTQGKPHTDKPIEKVAKITKDSPEWFINGVNAAMLAPTAINQQRFYLEQEGENGVKAKALLGPCSKTDLGIVKYHFELGAGTENFHWVPNK